jgi:hypothetical protein
VVDNVKRRHEMNDGKKDGVLLDVFFIIVYLDLV